MFDVMPLNSEKALQGGVREKVELATKFAVSFADGKMEVRGDPAYVRAACEGSLKRLGVDFIDLYYQHRIDKKVPIEVTVSAVHLPHLIPLFGSCGLSPVDGRCEHTSGVWKCWSGDILALQLVSGWWRQVCWRLVSTTYEWLY